MQLSIYELENPHSKEKGHIFLLAQAGFKLCSLSLPTLARPKTSLY